MTEISAARAAAALIGEHCVLHAPLGARTTYRVGGTADAFLVAEGDEDLARVAAAVRATGVSVLVVGKGSNLLVSDAGFRGLALALGQAFTTIDIGEGTVRVGGATDLPVLARRTAMAGWRGLEWAVGVPGSVGGGVRMNAGGHGSDVAERLRKVRIFDVATGQDGVVVAADLDLGYRRSNLGPNHVVVWAEFDVHPGDPQEAGAEVSKIVRWRRQHQPGGQNAGSVFTNPPDDSAGRLIELAGGKGLRMGTAKVSAKHANFIQADAGGSADDVLALIQEVRRRVLRTTGVELVPEVRLVGFPSATVASS
ncbi:MAG TPA: UDP-N-acetylmuramate dehydrogenase [Acidimicrobiales bacterium]|nr:UDP-N-acetylmuramate dehydrogenase [Acidimicrobiales bacterium]